MHASTCNFCFGGLPVRSLLEDQRRCVQRGDAPGPRRAMDSQPVDHRPHEDGRGCLPDPIVDLRLPLTVERDAAALAVAGNQDEGRRLRGAGHFVAVLAAPPPGQGGGENAWKRRRALDPEAVTGGQVIEGIADNRLRNTTPLIDRLGVLPGDNSYRMKRQVPSYLVASEPRAQEKRRR